MSTGPTELYRVIERMIEQKLRRLGVSGVQFGHIPSGYVSGNPALLLPEEATPGTKTQKVIQPYSNRTSPPVASQLAPIAFDKDDNRAPLGQLVDLSAYLLDADLVMGLRPVAPGNTQLLAADTEQSTASATYVEVKRFKVTRPGRYRIKGQLSRTGGTARAIVRVRLPDGTEVDATAEATYSGTVFPAYGAQFSLDMAVTLDWGAILKVYLLNDSGPAQTAYIKNVKLCYADASAALVPHDAVLVD